MPQQSSMRVNNKTFYFDYGQNARGVFMRISEVRYKRHFTLLLRKSLGQAAMAHCHHDTAQRVAQGDGDPEERRRDGQGRDEVIAKTNQNCAEFRYASFFDYPSKASDATPFYLRLYIDARTVTVTSTV